jgi:hypothetical protein
MPMACRQCGRCPLRPVNRPDVDGVPHAGRGLCRPCYQRPATRRSAYAPIGRGGYTTGRRSLHVLEDLEGVGAQIDPRTRAGFTPSARAELAHQLRVSQSTLDRAIYRARDQRAA